mmetsp:Transcript_20161/g.43797  ORF Transcript_20161/g.43797 Transcript_20161/m.43797 type:complete len:241 (+) Transcript_20161:111-833(+)|eukprot:CAMPEP_0172320490 /NCGR_PEP_ID=MMETSP1058-20130122/40677_1 /TAXON_ID=83371 /ORGANISM="Detonula confervacea, Strain CCMP 353" /LENGTH=240 /DNA_ID=CAMNT_0013035769 /DNA_START=81 /DNA_END=803 /DNA_ORIENTATION=+
MSLAFVKSAVLSSTDGVSHNEETTIDNTETQSLRAAGGGAQKPLFEQLRANKDAEQEKNDEFQRSLRGTRTLDDEDCAHLDSVERVKEDKAYAVKSEMEREVALFHAAREDRGLAQTVMIEGGGNSAEEAVRESAATKAKTDPIAAKKQSKKIVPKFTIKKKRKRVSQESDSKNTETNQTAVAQKKNSNESKACETKGDKESGTSNNSEENKPSPATNDSDSDNEGGGLLGLGCYGSDSD